MSGRPDPSMLYSGAINEGTEHRYDGGTLSDRLAARIADDVLSRPAARPDDGPNGWGERHFRAPDDGLPRSSSNGPRTGYGDPRR